MLIKLLNHFANDLMLVASGCIHYTKNWVEMIKFKNRLGRIITLHHLAQRSYTPNSVFTRIQLYEVAWSKNFICDLLVKVEFFARYTLTWLSKFVSVNVAVGIHSQKILFTQKYVCKSFQHSDMLFAFLSLRWFAKEWH